MKSDPKFGWHIYWIAPLFILGSLYGNTIGRLIKWYKAARREKQWTPEQKRLQVLAGIRKKEDL